MTRSSILNFFLVSTSSAASAFAVVGFFSAGYSADGDLIVGDLLDEGLLKGEKERAVSAKEMRFFAFAGCPALFRRDGLVEEKAEELELGVSCIIGAETAAASSFAMTDLRTSFTRRERMMESVSIHSFTLSALSARRCRCRVFSLRRASRAVRLLGRTVAS